AREREERALSRRPGRCGDRKPRPPAVPLSWRAKPGVHRLRPVLPDRPDPAPELGLAALRGRREHGQRRRRRAADLRYVEQSPEVVPRALLTRRTDGFRPAALARAPPWCRSVSAANP